MKNLHEINEKKVPAVRLDTSLNKYDNVVLFPEKLALANERIKKSGFPKLDAQKDKNQKSFGTSATTKK